MTDEKRCTIECRHFHVRLCRCYRNSRYNEHTDDYRGDVPVIAGALCRYEPNPGQMQLTTEEEEAGQR